VKAQFLISYCTKESRTFVGLISPTIGMNFANNISTTF